MKSSDEMFLFSKARTLAARLRKTGKYPATVIVLMLKEIYSAGYANGSEEQMKARILDKMEYAQKLKNMPSKV